MSSTPRRRAIPPHWTPRYVLDRSLLELHQRRRPDDPWLTADAVGFLDQWVRPGDSCLEWGSGRSTWWLSRHGVDVATVEHHAGWAAEVRATEAGPGTIALAHVAADDEDGYVGAHPDLAPVDLAIVDGIHRDGCALRAVELVRPGGVLLVDNVERYLPHRSRSPEARGLDEPEPGWATFAQRTAGWRCWWTSSGVTDTALWFRPTER